MVNTSSQWKSILVLICLVALVCGAVWAQDAATPAAVNPVLQPDTEILKRSPKIDGNVETGEWDGFYSFAQGKWQCTTYLNWDNGNLYFSAKSSKPFDMMVLLDANDDGWFHGEDNFEFRAIRGSDGIMAKSVLRYESRNVSSTIPTPVAEVENRLVEMASGPSEGTYSVEFRIPEYLVRDYRISRARKSGIQIAIRTDSDEASWIPATVCGEKKQCASCTFVTEKAVALNPLSLEFGVREHRVARGEEVTALLKLVNQGAQTIDVRSIVVGGEGKSSNFLDSLKRRYEGLTSRKKITEEMKSRLPMNMPLGTWVVGTEVRSENGRLGAALASFDVVDVFDVDLRVPPRDVPADVKDVTIGVVVKSNSRKNVWGKVKITLPTGWELWRGVDTREFTIRGLGQETSVVFRTRPPIGAAGNVPVTVSITTADTQRIVEGSFKVVAP